MNKPKILLIVGTRNQTTMMHQIHEHLKEGYDCYFSPFYADGWLKRLRNHGWLENTIMGNKTILKNLQYFAEHGLKADHEGTLHKYDLVFMCQDFAVPKNILDVPKILVQEGALMPMDWRFHFVKATGLPRALADTSMTGLSHHYNYFCVASEGFKNELIRRGVNGDKIKVTGLPNFDNVKQYHDNNFPHKNFVLAATSDLRETFRYEDRSGFIRKVLQVAKGRQVIFKLHPNENHKSATQEIKKYAPEALVYTKGNIEEMIANCDVLLTKYSSVVLTAAALGKEVHSEFTPEELKQLVPVQTNGTSAKIIAEWGESLITKNCLSSTRYQRAS